MTSSSKQGKGASKGKLSFYDIFSIYALGFTYDILFVVLSLTVFNPVYLDYAMAHRKSIALADIFSLESLRKRHKELWEKEPYFSRREKIQTRCSDVPLRRRIDLSRMIYDDQHQSIMCVVPKVFRN